MAFTTPNSFTEFMDWIRTGGAEPARSNLYSVFCGFPAIIRDRPSYDFRKWYEYVNFSADDVTVPSRQVTTGEVRDHGISRKYATGQVNSPITISFLVTKDLWLRSIFEQWMLETAGDQENRVGFYDQYTTNILIQKWELGSNVVYRDNVNTVKVAGVDKPSKERLNRVTGVWQLLGAFPTNVSVMQLNNESTTIMKMDVEFAYERYRFSPVLENLGWANQPDKFVDRASGVNRLLGIDSLGGDAAQSEVNDFGI